MTIDEGDVKTEVGPRGDDGGWAWFTVSEKNEEKLMMRYKN